MQFHTSLTSCMAKEPGGRCCCCSDQHYTSTTPARCYSVAIYRSRCGGLGVLPAVLYCTCQLLLQACAQHVCHLFIVDTSVCQSTRRSQRQILSSGVPGFLGDPRQPDCPGSLGTRAATLSAARGAREPRGEHLRLTGVHGY